MSFKRKFNAYLGMTKRNILLFFKDKSTMFFSMLAPLIVLFLYLVFLKDTYVDSIQNVLNEINFSLDKKYVDALVSCWLLSGLLGTSCITVSLSSLGAMVTDKEKKIDYDYNSAPISGPIITLSYFTSALINTFIISAGILTIGLIILSVNGFMFFGVETIIILYLVLLLGCASATMIMMLIVSFFKNNSAFGSFTGIVSAAVGFLIGAYIPIGQFAEPVQIFANIFPGAHITSLFRNYLMEGIIDEVNNVVLMGIDNGTFSEGMNAMFGFNLNFFSFDVSKNVMYIYSSVMIIVTLIVNILLYRFYSKRK